MVKNFVFRKNQIFRMHQSINIYKNFRMQMKNPFYLSLLLTLSNIQYLAYLISITFACFFAIKHTPFYILIPKIT